MALSIHPVKTLFIVEHGDPFPEEESPLKTITGMDVPGMGPLTTLTFLFLDKVKKWLKALTCTQAEWGLYLGSDECPPNIKNPAIRAMEKGFQMYTAEALSAVCERKRDLEISMLKYEVKVAGKEGETRGREEGREDNLRTIVHNMRKRNLSDAEIADLTGAPLETVKNL